MSKFKFENQFESREQFESVLQKSFPFYIRTMSITSIACAIYEMLFLLRLLLGMSSGGHIKHLHYGSCYAFMLLLCLWTLIRLSVFKKDTVKYARRIYRTQIISNLGVALWATAITLLDGYYHNSFNVTLFVIVLMMLPIISFENPYILGTTHLVLNIAMFAVILVSGNSADAMNFIPIASVLFILSFFVFNNRKKLYINEYVLDEIEIKKLNRELKEKDTLLDEADQEQKMREEQHQAELLKQLKLVNALSQDYLNVFLIDTENNTANVMKMDGYVIEGTSKERSDYPYDTISKKYIEQRVFSEDKEMMLGVMDIQNLREKLKNNVEYMGIYRINETDGVHYYQYKFVRIEGTDSIIAGFQNVDEMIASEKEQQNRLQRALEEAKSSSEAKSSFLFNMSHDIRTPMNAILGFARLMEKELDNPDVAKDYLSKIEYSGEYLLSIINNVLDMARIESGKVTLDEELMHTLSAGTNAVHMLMADIKKKNLTFTHSEDFQHNYVLADEAKLNQIFVNILSNSVKYTPEGGSIHMDLKEFPSEKEGYGKFVIEISDTGIGMSEEFQKEIFESFSREKNTTDSKVTGTGLGMSIVKKLVDLMGGTIEVESQIGKGSTFRLTSDFKLADDVTIASHSKETEKEAVEFTGKRILLAEDNELNAEIAIAILEDLGLKVERAEDGVVCIDMLNKAEDGYYDLILMDIQMPNLDGYSATKKIRNLSNPAKANIPIIAMTANAFAEDKQKAFDVGMNGHLAKPIDTNELIQTLAQYCR